jgi:putative holliday junction resolvase
MISSNPKNEINWGHKVVLALDYGEKVTGLAKYQIGRDPFPYPYGRLFSSNPVTFQKELKKVLADEDVEIVVLGLPTFLDGKESTMTQKIKNVGLTLQSFLPPSTLFFFQDETLSTFEAQERMRNSPRYNFKVCPQEIDALSACIILEDFLKKHLLLTNA